MAKILHTLLLDEPNITLFSFFITGNGGPECAKFSSPQRQVLEFIAGITLALISLLIGEYVNTQIQIFTTKRRLPKSQ